jgi:hypothetical protein
MSNVPIKDIDDLQPSLQGNEAIPTYFAPYIL